MRLSKDKITRYRRAWEDAGADEGDTGNTGN
jgi:hypothetical protein